MSPEELKTVLSGALETAHKAGIKLEWYSPTCYKQFNPLEFGFGAKACSAAQYNLTIEPDGSVIPCQSWFKEKLGNILKDPWSDIWNHPVAVGFREKDYLKGRKECEGCEYLNAVLRWLSAGIFALVFLLALGLPANAGADTGTYRISNYVCHARTAKQRPGQNYL